MTSPQPSELLALMPFATELGIELIAASPAEAVGRLSWAPQRCTVGGLLHGGVVISLADSVGAVCAFLNLPPGCATATTNSTTHLFRGVRSGTVTATARPVHVGRSMIVVRTQVVDGEQRPVAETTQTQAVLPPRDRGSS